MRPETGPLGFDYDANAPVARRNNSNGDTRVRPPMPNRVLDDERDGADETLLVARHADGHRIHGYADRAVVRVPRADPCEDGVDPRRRRDSGGRVDRLAEHREITRDR